MITNKTAAKIAKISALAITDRLRSTAYEQVVENFCLPRCGHTPNGDLCAQARQLHRQLLRFLFQAYSQEN